MRTSARPFVHLNAGMARVRYYCSPQCASAIRAGRVRHRRKLRALIQRHDWIAALSMVGSHERLPLLAREWPRVATVDRARVLAEALCGGDLPRRELSFLRSALAELREAGILAYDLEAARVLHEQLPEQVTIYRGTVTAELANGQIGVCWTLDRSIAEWFATEHERFRTLGSVPLVLQTTIAKHEVCGLLLERQEAEVLAVSMPHWSITWTNVRRRQ
jgi:hypothetical protein